MIFPPTMWASKLSTACLAQNDKIQMIDKTWYPSIIFFKISFYYVSLWGKNGKSTISNLFLWKQKLKYRRRTKAFQNQSEDNLRFWKQLVVKCELGNLLCRKNRRRKIRPQKCSMVWKTYLEKDFDCFNFFCFISEFVMLHKKAYLKSVSGQFNLNLPQ